jgi:hypothetical protein
MTNRSCFSTTQSPYQHEATTNTPYGIRSGRRAMHMQTQVRTSTNRRQTNANTSQYQHESTTPQMQTQQDEGGGWHLRHWSLLVRKKERVPESRRKRNKDSDNNQTRTTRTTRTLCQHCHDVKGVDKHCGVQRWENKNNYNLINTNSVKWGPGMS